MDPRSASKDKQDLHAAEKNDFLRQLAISIRAYRKRRGLSLSELARRAGVAKGTLSRLELGEGNPTIMTLTALAGELAVTPSDFLTSAAEHGVAPPPLAGPTLDMRFVSRVRTSSVWEIYETVIPARTEPLYSETHRGMEHLLLLEGEAHVGPVDDPVLLVRGEHTSFAGSSPHFYWSPKGPSRALLIMDYPLSED
ncbi:MAG: helix-turn-helix domain-containing protein [Spiribacter salinus]|uniref:Helix-turn-helix domain-containing protein n=1 Tax=Spiribacter salinus TaxID=1335746 RepID=A0A540VTV8_9GAMM|nr:MAG: helix-turn-helix domain-containing protein [Spiribacter salinus]